jgi:aminoglycoside/choline kinase family phosphotransferase
MKFKKHNNIIGVYNSNIRENEAFFYLTEVFMQCHICVPTLFIIDKSRCYYLLNDLGDETLYSFLTQHRQGDHIDDECIAYYKKTLSVLVQLQMISQDINFDFAYPRHSFDKQSMMWDLNYFKYYFLKLANVAFDEQLLENDFQTLIAFLLEAGQDYFLFRDFQSRNIMLHQGKVFLIDYQGGRKGALQYDLASLLYDGKANIPPAIRDELFNFYLDALSKTITVNRSDFIKYYNAFVLIRILQAMGTYGFRGYYERKAHFLLSIPYAVRNICYLLKHNFLDINIPELKRVLTNITESSELPSLSTEQEGLTVTVNSFSYKKGIPHDWSVNGGGFVFDCRALPNPGRKKQYSKLNGTDKVIIRYLESYPETDEFKQHAYALIDASVNNYIERNFTHLMVNFGCTGGQHRSVYFAECMAQHLRIKYPEIRVVLNHTNIDL